MFPDYFNRKFEYFILLTIAANCVVLMLEEPLPNGDTTERNKKLVRAKTRILLCFSSKTNINHNALLLGLSIRKRFKRFLKNSYRRELATFIVIATWCLLVIVAWKIVKFICDFLFLVIVLISPIVRKNLKCISWSFTASKLQRRLWLTDSYCIRMPIYEMAGIFWILWLLWSGKLFIYLSDSGVCSH